MPERYRLDRRKAGTGHRLAVLLVYALLLLAVAACGRSRQVSEAELPTPVPTFAPPATIAPPATPTPEPAAETGAPADVTEETDISDIAGTEAGESTGDVAESDDLASEPLTATAEITLTEEIEAGEEVVVTEEIVATEELTTTEESSATTNVTTTEEISAVAEVAATEEMTVGVGVENVQAISAGEEMTATEEISPAEEITVPEEITAAAEMTVGVGVENVQAISAGEEMTATEEISSAEEITVPDASSATGEITATEELTVSVSVDDAQSIPPTIGADESISETGTITATGAITVDDGVSPAVFFLQPTANAIVPVTSTVIWGYTGLVVQPAGEAKEDAGHLHLLIDEEFVPAGEEIPQDESHLHLGNGSAETEVMLTPGIHTLRVQFADGNHVALAGEEYRDEIIVRADADAPEQSVRFVMPSDGATVPPEFDVVMAATGLIVEPSGMARAGAGHLHILVDTDFVEPGDTIPQDETHLHFGGGQLSGSLNLEPGEHVLGLQFADGAHVALAGEQYRSQIDVTVDADAPAQQVMFVMPEDGAIVTTTVMLEWAAAGLIIEPAGSVIRDIGGHLHVLIDEEFVPAGEAIPSTDTSLHFGGAQTSTVLELEPGEHTLRVQMANGSHIALDGDKYRDEITITVEEAQ